MILGGVLGVVMVADNLAGKLSTTEPSQVRAADLGYIGGISLSRGEYERAEECFWESLVIYSHMGRDDEVASQHSGLAEVYLKTGQYDKAEFHLQECMSIEKKLKDGYGWLILFSRLGDVNLARKNFAEAEADYQRNLGFHENLSDGNGTAMAYYKLGMLAEAQGDLDQACEKWQRALVLYVAEEKKGPPWVGRVMLIRELQSCIANRSSRPFKENMLKVFDELSKKHTGVGWKPK